MRRSVTALLVLSVLLLSAALTGCALPGADEPVVTDPADPSAQPSEATTPAVPPESETEVVSIVLGEEAMAGPWTLFVEEAEFGDSFGDLSAQPGGTLLKVEVELSNSSASGLMVTPSDFMLSDGNAYTLPLETGPALTPERLVPAGGTEILTAVFSIPQERIDAPLGLIFQPAEGEPVSIAVTIR
jgi:hypothetical protein